ncbi:MAG: M20/M25/M40 family metallo-hydrolase, partial [Kangiellaceae bacterium]|nr:M20/M25/M40 family metallo-hydrolase [Kangiellaceae bacterium]
MTQGFYLFRGAVIFAIGLLLQSTKVESADEGSSATDLTAQQLSVSEITASRYQSAAINFLAELISYQTVTSAGTPLTLDDQFIGFKESLKRKAKALGLSFKADDYFITLSIGQGEKILGLIAHGDVRPVKSSQWQSNPFKLKQEGSSGRLIGRGTANNKGPIAAAVYSMRSLLDQGAPLRGRIELLIYFDNKTDTKPLANFLESYQPAPINIILNGTFPAATAEKGRGIIK